MVIQNIIITFVIKITEMEKEVRIQFETAKLAKEKGYRISNQYVFDENTGELLPRDPAYPGWHDYAIVDGVCASPTQSLLQKWIRDNHGIDIIISTHSMDKNVRAYSLYHGRFMGDEYWPMLSFLNVGDDDRFDTYEKALEVGLQESLRLI